MNKKESLTQYKMKAKEQLLGNYSLVIAAFVLNFVLSYAIMSIVSGLLTSLALGNAAENVNIEMMMANPDTSNLMLILNYIVMAVIAPVMAIISTGFLYILRELTYERIPRVNDLFYAFKNHPDRVIIIALINYAVQIILNIPVMILSRTIMNEPDGKTFLVYAVVIIVDSILTIIYFLYISQSYLVYLDNSELSSIDCMKRSITIMKGNVWRLFYLMLTFAGYALLVIVSVGIAALWVVPYIQMTMINFYKGLNEERTIEV